MTRDVRLTSHDTADANIGSRVKYGICCSAWATLFGVVLPLVWYQVWNGQRKSDGEADLSILPWMLSATVGVIAGGISGLIAGMTTCSRLGIATAFSTQGIAHLGLLILYVLLCGLLPFVPWLDLYAWSTLPSSIIEFSLALTIWACDVRLAKKL